MFKIGVDLGYGYTKVKNEKNQSLIIPSIISTIGTRDEITTLSNAMLKGLGTNSTKENYDDIVATITDKDVTKTYTIGEFAKRQSVNSGYVLNDNKIEAEETKVLLAITVAMLVPQEDVPLHIVTGLPVEQYVHLKAEFQKMLENFNVTVEIKSKKIKKVVKFDKVDVFIQAGAAVYPTVLGNTDKYLIDGSYIGVIDPGQKTTDYVVFFVEDGKLIFDEFKSGTVDIGMSMLETNIDKEFTRISKTGRKLDSELMDKLLAKGKIYSQSNGGIIDMTKTIKDTKESIASAIKNKIISNWKSNIDSFSYIVVAGGGGDALYQYFKNLLVPGHVILADNAQMANAEGYLKIASLVEMASGTVNKR